MCSDYFLILPKPGKAVWGESGELVCTKPLPCQPTHFWNDENGSKYRKAYFSKFPGRLEMLTELPRLLPALSSLCLTVDLLIPLSAPHTCPSLVKLLTAHSARGINEFLINILSLQLEAIIWNCNLGLVSSSPPSVPMAPSPVGGWHRPLIYL